MRNIISISTQKEQYLCDLCRYPMRKQYICRICRIDVCPSCGTFDPREMGDYPDMYCKPCWAAGEPFRAEEVIENDRHEAAMDEIYDRWKASVKK